MRYRASIIYGNQDYFLNYQDITAFEYLGFIRQQGFLPWSREGKREVSNSELKRWLEKGSVRISGGYLRPDDIVDFPVDELVFFSGSKTQCTVI